MLGLSYMDDAEPQDGHVGKTPSAPFALGDQSAPAAVGPNAVAVGRERADLVAEGELARGLPLACRDESRVVRSVHTHLVGVGGIDRKTFEVEDLDFQDWQPGRQRHQGLAQGVGLGPSQQSLSFRSWGRSYVR